MGLQVALLLRFCADLGDEFESLLSDMELFNGVEGLLMRNDLSIAYEKLLTLLTDDEDLVRAKVSQPISAPSVARLCSPCTLTQGIDCMHR